MPNCASARALKACITSAFAALVLMVCAPLSSAQAPGEAFVMVATDALTTASNEGYSFAFQRIDLATLTIAADQPVIVTFTGMGGGDEFRRPQSLRTTMRFGGQALPPGDYALIARTRRTSGRSTTDVATCYSYGAPVFRMTADVVSVVPEDEFAAAEARRDVQTLLEAHPTIAAPVASAELVGHVSFATTTRRQQEYCEPNGPLTFRAPLPPTQ